MGIGLDFEVEVRTSEIPVRNARNSDVAENLAGLDGFSLGHVRRDLGKVRIEGHVAVRGLDPNLISAVDVEIEEFLVGSEAA